jgi:hypothetical protein
MGDQEQRSEDYEERGGEAACWAHLVCPDCGAMESEGHRPNCPAARPASRVDQPIRPPSEQPSRETLRP